MHISGFQYCFPYNIGFGVYDNVPEMEGSPVAVTPEDLKEIALSQQEYQDIQERLGREPNSLELGLFGALWSEHCAYKHSRSLLRLFPSDSPRVLVAPGSENAGVVDVGD